MKLGLHLAYWGLGFGPEDQARLAQEAERLGYDSVWTAEAYGSDAATVLGWLAPQTARIRLGSAVFQMPARSPAMTAMTAATIDHLSDGRLLLGLGSSGPQVAEGWHGQRFGRQLQRTREYVEVVRKALDGERLEYKGEAIELPLPNGPGKPLKLSIRPVQRRIPIYIAANGPRNTELAGEIADGIIPAFFSPEHAEAIAGPLRKGTANVGRRPAAVPICPWVNFHIGPDPGQRAESTLRDYLALYIGGMGSRERNFYKSAVEAYGFTDAPGRIQDLYLDGKKNEAKKAVPLELIDTVSLFGSREHVIERLRAFDAAGVDTVIATPTTTDLGSRIAQLRELAAAAEAI